MAICLLFSWTFDYILQDDQVEFENGFKVTRILVSGIEFLRLSQDKYGEEILAFQRGVFITTLPFANAALHKPIRLFSSQLKIIHAKPGVVDNPYATAWNIGRRNTPG